MAPVYLVGITYFLCLAAIICTAMVVSDSLMPLWLCILFFMVKVEERKP